MECNKFTLEKIGETDSAEFRDHRAACAACVRDLEELREVRALYRSASREKYSGRVPRVGRFRTAWVPMAAAAAVLLLVFGLILGGPGEKPSGKRDEVTGASLFVRVHLEPWGSDVTIARAFEDCWQRLDDLEKTR